MSLTICNIAVLWLIIIVLVLLSDITKAWISSRPHFRLCAPLQMKSERIIPPLHRMEGEVELPGSKSITNRILLLSALAKGSTTITNVLDSEDTQHMLAALMTLKVDVQYDKLLKVARINGNGGIFVSETDETTSIYLGNAGTAMRPLTAVLSASQGQYLLDGTARMRERPIADLVDGLQQLGVDLDCASNGCPPVRIRGKGINGGDAVISGKISSQFLSALLLASPLASKSVTVRIKDQLVSAPYVQMTINLMRKFGVHVKNEDNSVFSIAPTQYVSPGEIFIEGDASSASYFLAGAAISRGTVTVHGCGQESIQGDVRFADVLRRMGAKVSYGVNSITITGPEDGRLIGVDEDCGDIPDAAMTLAIVGLFAKGKTIIRNVYNWRVKETDRMTALTTELRKLGAIVEEGNDYLVVHGVDGHGTSMLKQDVCIETYDDHRIAMCFSLVPFAGVPIRILDPKCVDKTFPTYFDMLTKLTTSS